MFRMLLLWTCLVLALSGAAMAAAKEPTDQEADAKELSGMSIIGNDEAPKALFIVPWKSSELGGETSMDMLLNERAAPVDRDVFMRQLEFYEISTAGTRREAP